MIERELFVLSLTKQSLNCSETGNTCARQTAAQCISIFCCSDNRFQPDQNSPPRENAGFPGRTVLVRHKRLCFSMLYFGSGNVGYSRTRICQESQFGFKPGIGGAWMDRLFFFQIQHQSKGWNMVTRVWPAMRGQVLVKRIVGFIRNQNSPPREADLSRGGLF